MRSRAPLIPSHSQVRVTSVQPTTIPLGVETVISGSGDLNADQSGGTYTMTMKGVGDVDLLDELVDGGLGEDVRGKKASNS